MKLTEKNPNSSGHSIKTKIWAFSILGFELRLTAEAARVSPCWLTEDHCLGSLACPHLLWFTTYSPWQPTQWYDSVPTWPSSKMSHNHLLSTTMCQALSDAEKNQTLCAPSKSSQNFLDLVLRSPVQAARAWNAAHLKEMCSFCNITVGFKHLYERKIPH